MPHMFKLEHESRIRSAYQLRSASILFLNYEADGPVDNAASELIES